MEISAFALSLLIRKTANPHAITPCIACSAAAATAPTDAAAAHTCCVAKLNRHKGIQTDKQQRQLTRDDAKA